MDDTATSDGMLIPRPPRRGGRESQILELENIKEVFEKNGYDRKEIERSMKEKDKTAEYKENEETRGMVVIQNIPNFTLQFNKIARKH